MSSAWVTSFEKARLWMYLQALGFEPCLATIACGNTVSHTQFGVNMFDKLNRDAFHIVSYFLFQTLDKSLTKEVFKHCWPPFDQKRDVEFRKLFCEWLKKISAECGSSFPQVVGSLFLFPVGPKFIHIMYHFARFVAVKYIKTHSKNSSIRFTETFNVKPQDLHICLARCLVARNRFLQVLQREDCVTRKYQENAQLSVKQVRNLRSECMGLENQIKKMEPCDDQSNIQEKIQKLHTGNIYEAGKLNILTVFWLLNEVLKVMKCECCQTDQARLTIDLHFLEKETRFQKERLSDLKHMRYKITEALKTIRHSIVEKQEEWHKKWKEFLGLSPFSIIKGSTPAVDLLPPMSPLSFDPASEEAYARSILLQYPASLPVTPKQHIQENNCRRASDTLETKSDPPNSPASFPLQPVPPLGGDIVTLLEKDTKLVTLREKNETVPKKTPEFNVENSSSSNIVKNTDSSACGGSLPAKKSNPFQKEQDHLVEEVARAVLSNSPQLSEEKEVKLEELIDSLISNPFLTRSQIPRTPENLISEIRSSWRKAVDTEDNRSTEPIQVDTERREELPESLPVVHNQKEFSMASFLSAATVSNSSHSHLPEEKVVSDCLECVPQKPVVTTCIGEPTTQNPSDLLNKDIICMQDLDCTTLQNKLLETSQIETFSPAVGNRRNVLGSSEEDNIKISDQSKASYKDFSMYNSMLWNCFQVSSEISSSFKDGDFGILHETLPEVGHISLISPSSTEATFNLEPNSPMHSGIFTEDVVGEKQTTPESDFNLQATCSGYEALKKSPSKQREEIYLSNPEILERHKPELSLTPQKMQTDDMLNFLGIHDLHIDYTKPSSRMSLGERKRSLSPLIKFSPVEQRLKTTIPCSLGELLSNLTEEEILNKSLDAEVSPSDSTR
uniref:HAUS augmin like complex subunit 6 n=1 Tax=Bos taurus TaxID=9913 RepID=A0AAA9T889_BOVIN